ncbi:hypothetical protein M5689_001935 [Euphorbia peplus]|nr:hypothetical protein M5689_001935 [Euphorbia peplus]
MESPPLPPLQGSTPEIETPEPPFIDLSNDILPAAPHTNIVPPTPPFIDLSNDDLPVAPHGVPTTPRFIELLDDTFTPTTPRQARSVPAPLPPHIVPAPPSPSIALRRPRTITTENLSISDRIFRRLVRNRAITEGIRPISHRIRRLAT